MQAKIGDNIIAFNWDGTEMASGPVTRFASDGTPMLICRGHNGDIEVIAAYGWAISENG